MSGGSGFEVRDRRGSAQAFHDLELPEPARREVWVFAVDAPTLVLGSTQRDGVVDVDAARRRGIEVARRRSGGGAVLLAPGGAVWIDVVLPRGDPLWDDDVSRSGRWLGRVWVDALEAVGVDGPLLVHEGPLDGRDLGSLVCFAGLGPGEVVTTEGAKVVGMSQRRTRAGARLQTTVLRSWDPATYEALLAPAGLAPGALAGVAVAPVAAPPTDLVDAFLSHLP